MKHAQPCSQIDPSKSFRFEDPSDYTLPTDVFYFFFMNGDASVTRCRKLKPSSFPGLPPRIHCHSASVVDSGLYLHGYFKRPSRFGLVQFQESFLYRGYCVYHGPIAYELSRESENLRKWNITWSGPRL